MQISIVRLSEIIRENSSFRLDAEHYQKQYFDNQDKLLKFGSQPLSNIIYQPVITGYTPSMKIEAYYNGNIDFVKTDNLREFRIGKQFSHYLSNFGNGIIKKVLFEKSM